MDFSQTLAVVSMGITVPGANDIPTFWDNILKGRSFFSEASFSDFQLEPSLVLEKGQPKKDKVYNLRGAFNRDCNFTASELKTWNLKSSDLDTWDFNRRFLLKAAFEALNNKKLLKNHNPEKLGLIYGQVVLPTKKTSQVSLETIGKYWEKKLGFATEPINLSSDALRTVGYSAQKAAEIIGFKGLSFTVDAACASSLYALKLACEELLNGNLTAVLTGGVAAADRLFTQMGFCQLRALSVSGFSSPFDQKADGLLVGDGAALLLLKRLDQAINDGDKPLALIRGMGLSNDQGPSLLAPKKEGQLRAMEEAWQLAGLKKAQAGLIEAHGTGTPLGDAVELSALKEFWQDSGQTAVLGSVKGNVGHLLSAAGAVSLVKSVLSLKEKILPPSGGFETLSSTLDLGQHFEILKKPQKWAQTELYPRRAVVNAFGFGGTNAQVILEEYQEKEKYSFKTKNNPKKKRNVVLVAWEDFLGKEKTIEKSSGFQGEAFLAPELTLDALAYKSPPKDLSALLPQQALFLKTGHLMWHKLAQKGLGFQGLDFNRFGLVVNIDLGLSSADYALRWLWTEKNYNKLREKFNFTEKDFAILKDEIKPSLTAEATLGALGSVVASRLARFLKFGGPCFTVSSGSSIELVNLKIAYNFLNSGLLDLLLIGAVDTPSDYKNIILNLGNICQEGALAAILTTEEVAKKQNWEILAKLDSDLNSENKILLQKKSELKAGALEGFLNLGKSVKAISEKINVNSEIPWLIDVIKGPRQIEFSKAKLKLREPDLDYKGPDYVFSKLGGALFFIPGEDRVSLFNNLKFLEVKLKEKDTTLLGLAGFIWQEFQNQKWRTAVIAKDLNHLKELIEILKDYCLLEQKKVLNKAIFWPAEKEIKGDLAFLFPGSGNQYPLMGLNWAQFSPKNLSIMHGESDYLASQFKPDLFWQKSIKVNEEELILGQVSLADLIYRCLIDLNLKPKAVLGYSLGESAALIATKAWPKRDELFLGLQNSPLFKQELAGEYKAARSYFKLKKEDDFNWLVALASISVDDFNKALKKLDNIYQGKVFLQIVNGPQELLLGGEKRALLALQKELQTSFIILKGVSAVHNPTVKSVSEMYRNLHLMETNPPLNIDFYSPAWGKKYELNKESAANSIVAQAVNGHDFQKLIKNAYDDGIRFFLELGPGQSITRMVNKILNKNLFWAASVDKPLQNKLNSLLKVLANLGLSGYNVDLAPLYLNNQESILPEKIKVPVVFNNKILNPEVVWKKISTKLAEKLFESKQRDAKFKQKGFNFKSKKAKASMVDEDSYLKWLTSFATESTSKICENEKLENKTELINPPRSFDRHACLAFAVGKLAPVLGVKYAGIDKFPTRVRLPAEPLMLVDRILTIEGEPLEQKPARIVTQHDVLEDAWYLDNGHIPASLAIESGQADLFLASFLGMDYLTKGKARYRLLDAEVVMYRELPKPNEIVTYDIRITRFFKHDQTHLFRFEFEAKVGDELILTMRNGCAGFFTPYELAQGRGIPNIILESKKDSAQINPQAINFVDFNSPESLSAEKVISLREGDLKTVFGKSFASIKFKAQTIPGGMLALIDRVNILDPCGGRYKKGLVRTEADIDPQAWFLTSHFVDDQVMPGTLMFEGCLHAFRVYLLRLGWLGDVSKVDWQPKLGVETSLKCRGQVTAGVKIASYEVHIKEIGFDPEPYAIGDGVMFADGHPIVDISNISLRLRGSSLAELKKIWHTSQILPLDFKKQKAIFSKEKLLAFAERKPSEAFGEKFKKFDERFIARLPRPPYDLIDRVMKIDAQANKMQAGGEVWSQYDLKSKAWFLEEARANKTLPYAILNEIALQPCGFLSAYVGSSFSSDNDLHFRNLGGRARILKVLSKFDQILSTKAVSTKMSKAAGMIIQHYNFFVYDEKDLIYEGETYFGFFSPQSLAAQAGLSGEGGDPNKLKEDFFKEKLETIENNSNLWPTNRLRLLDEIKISAGESNLVAGFFKVDPKAWFFKAHFYQDPVWPGSLGLEAFLQLGKAFACKHFNPKDNIICQAPKVNTYHNWIYRGQVIPTNKEVFCLAEITNLNLKDKTLTLKGFLFVDDLPIYYVEDFSLVVVENSAN